MVVNKLPINTLGKFVRPAVGTLSPNAGHELDPNVYNAALLPAVNVELAAIVLINGPMNGNAEYEFTAVVKAALTPRP